MDTIITSVLGALDTLLKMPSILLYALALNVIGWVLKRTPLNNRYIPAVIIALSTLVTPFLIPGQAAGDVANHVPYPELADWIRRISLGIVVGFVAWGAHAWLLKHVEKYLPSIGGGDDGNGPPAVGLLVLLAACLAAGCASAPAYKTLYAAGHATDAAVKSYFDLVVAKKVSTNGVPQVARAYENFQAAYRLALAVAEFNPTGPPDTNVTARATAVLGAVANAKGRLP